MLVQLTKSINLLSINLLSINLLSIKLFGDNNVYLFTYVKKCAQQIKIMVNIYREASID